MGSSVARRVNKSSHMLLRRTSCSCIFLPAFIPCCAALADVLLSAILVTEAGSSIYDRTRFGTYLGVRPPCSGVVPQACCGTWVNLTASGRPTTTCLQDGNVIFSHSVFPSILTKWTTAARL